MKMDNGEWKMENESVAAEFTSVLSKLRIMNAEL